MGDYDNEPIDSPPPQHLGTFPRYPDEELRVSLDYFMDRPYLCLRVWSVGKYGELPIKGKGVSIRLSEIEGFRKILAQVEVLIMTLGSRHQPIDLDEFKVPFGMHKGKSLKTIARTDEGIEYLRWLSTHTTNKKVGKRLQMHLATIDSKSEQVETEDGDAQPFDECAP